MKKLIVVFVSPFLAVPCKAGEITLDFPSILCTQHIFPIRKENPHNHNFRMAQK